MTRWQLLKLILREVFFYPRHESIIHKDGRVERWRPGEK